MSRIGKKPIEIPSGVEVEIKGTLVTAKGPKGNLEKTIPTDVNIKRDGDTIFVERVSENPRHRSLHGLTRTIIANMITGVSEGFEKNLEIVGVGYRAFIKGQGLEIQVGYSMPKEYPKDFKKVDKIEGIQFEVPSPTKIVIKGADKELVGEIAAEIRAIRPPEPYKGKGIKYAGEHIRRKAGKTAK